LAEEAADLALLGHPSLFRLASCDLVGLEEQLGVLPQEAVLVVPLGLVLVASQRLGLLAFLEGPFLVGAFLVVAFVRSF
jgi:hypothetical protein